MRVDTGFYDHEGRMDEPQQMMICDDVSGFDAYTSEWT
jgi:hypothetical protein